MTQATLFFNQGRFKFSIGHFTIFSQTERETLHGHNYTLEIRVDTCITEPGITFDYRLFEEKLITLCKQLHWHFLIPDNSPYLTVVDDGAHYEIIFNGESMWLLKKDVVLLPLSNITLETLSSWFTTMLLQDQQWVERFQVKKLSVKVFNGPEHAAICSEHC